MADEYNYDEMLERLYQRLPKKSASDIRFEPPKLEISHIGNQTIIKNFSAVAAALRREPNHLFKFFTREVAAPASISGKQIIFQGHIPAHTLESKLSNYIKEFVICRECKRPDTTLIKKGKLYFLKCEACGAEASVRTV